MAGRRPRGDGSLFYDSAYKRWTGRVMIDGKRRTVTARTKTEARRKLADLRSQVDAGLPVAPGNLSLGDLLADWEAKALPGRKLADNSAAAHRWAVGVLTAEIGATRVRSLTPEVVERAFLRLATRDDRPLSRASLVKLRSTLAMALGWAERRGQIARNIGRVVELPSEAAPATTGRAMTADQARRFAEAAEDSPWRAGWLVGLHLGLRPGEIFGLSWSDLDLDAGVVHVRHALKRDAKGALSVGTTKTTGSIRSLAAPPVVIDAFRRRRTEQIAERLAAGVFWHNVDDLVFTNGAGGPVDPGRARREFLQVCEQAELSQNWSPVDLRHSCASLMSDAGVAIETVSDLLGHRDTRMASRHYRHPVRPVLDATRLGDVLAEGADASG